MGAILSYCSYLWSSSKTPTINHPDIPVGMEHCTRNDITKFREIDTVIESKFNHVYYCGCDFSAFNRKMFDMYATHGSYDENKTYFKDPVQSTVNGCYVSQFDVLYCIMDTNTHFIIKYYTAKHEHLSDDLKANMEAHCQCKWCQYNSSLGLPKPLFENSGCIKSNKSAESVIKETRDASMRWIRGGDRIVPRYGSVD